MAAGTEAGAIFDLATPPQRHAEVLRRLCRDGAVALIQKPMGSNLDGGDRDPVDLPRRGSLSPP